MSFERQRSILICGSSDFVRRISAYCKDNLSNFVTLSSPNLVEASSTIVSERPDVILSDIGLHANAEYVLRLRNLLSNCREKFGTQTYVILAATSPTKLALSGELLFKEDSTEPSGLIDNFLVSPPAGIINSLSLEEQLSDCLSFVSEELSRRDSGALALPALWEESWVPALAAPSSRKTWMRWLPRYATYINENPLIVGPTGAGKTRLAKAIHSLSGRTGPFVSITPRDFSSSELVQAELFGSAAGAYTGAVDKWGLVKRAEKGTLFIDELQSIDLDLQGKLITFIENKSYRRVGEAENHTADVRFVFATNQPLQSLVESGQLRDDFAFRLERIKLQLEPLSERRLDIPAALAFALARILRDRAANTLQNSTVEGLTNEAYAIVYSSSWPGNLRQLENTAAQLIERASINNQKLIDHEIAKESLSNLLGYSPIKGNDIYAKAAFEVSQEASEQTDWSIDSCTEALQEKIRELALEHSSGNVEAASELIKDSPKKMKLFLNSRQKL